jgi:hypothetical protein
MTAALPLVPLTDAEAAGLLEEWGVPLHVNPDPRPEPATLNLRVPAEVRDA